VRASLVAGVHLARGCGRRCCWCCAGAHLAAPPPAHAPAPPATPATRGACRGFTSCPRSPAARPACGTAACPALGSSRRAGRGLARSGCPTGCEQACGCSRQSSSRGSRGSSSRGSGCRCGARAASGRALQRPSPYHCQSTLKHTHTHTKLTCSDAASTARRATRCR
jgi:hypothetical protein